MKKWILGFVIFISTLSYSQSIKDKLSQAMAQMEADPQLRHAIVGCMVTNDKTGQAIYEHNAQTGLTPASTQKVFTSCAAFDVLGKDYRYATEIGYRNVKGSGAIACLYIKPSGDPSFGSSRFISTRPGIILSNIVTSLQRNKTGPVTDKIEMAHPFDDQIPGGWIWEDIGNYYGAGAFGFNWLENQYDLMLKSGKKIGDTAIVVEVKPAEVKAVRGGKLVSAEKGSGDNTIVYLPYGDDYPIIEGSIPVNENAFEVSASITNPTQVFEAQLINALKKGGIVTSPVSPVKFLSVPDSAMGYTQLYKHLSPSFDSLNYWFLKKSINLYGEAFIKTMALATTGAGSTKKGVELLKDFWLAKGIEKSALNICDGSGLSPQNRVTAAALVKALQYAKTRPWFTSFYAALPDYNGMKMKSGSIGGARAYAGYHTATDGNSYSFAIIVNNYDGASGAVVKKMYQLLDNLK
ncbi:MAG: D-alanyl-D-alanine carboxypeptidase/D-alanyl-D-alanine-endopeptidase [Chitinophagaceae bacterium]